MEILGRKGGANCNVAALDGTKLISWVTIESSISCTATKKLNNKKKCILFNCTEVMKVISDGFFSLRMQSEIFKILANY